MRTGFFFCLRIFALRTNWQASITSCVCVIVCVIVCVLLFVFLALMVLSVQQSLAPLAQQLWEVSPFNEISDMFAPKRAPPSPLTPHPQPPSSDPWKCFARMGSEGCEEMVSGLFLCTSCFPELPPRSHTLLFSSRFYFAGRYRVRAYFHLHSNPFPLLQCSC